MADPGGIEPDELVPEVPAGAAPVTKRAAEPEARQRLAAEAERLRTLCHPGVVALAGYEPDEDVDQLQTRFAGSLTLADYSPSDAGALAGVLAGVAAILGDLHRAGVSHGGLAPDHVIVSRTRHPVLCSFGRSGGADAAEIALDLEALASMIDDVVRRARRMPGRAGAVRAQRQRRRLRAAAAACRRGGPAEAVAALLVAVPGAGLAPPAEPSVGSDGEPAPRAVVTEAPDGTRTWPDRVRASTAPPPPGRRRVSGRAAVAAAGVTVAAALGLALARTSSPTGSPSTLGHEAAPETPTEPQSPSPTPALVATPPEPALAEELCIHRLPDAPGVDSDDDCAHDPVIHGNLVQVGRAWFRAGAAGDVIAVGDWDCDGTATPLVLRPGSGDVFVFDRWAGAEALEVHAVARAAGAVALEIHQSGECDLAYAVDADGAVGPDPIELS